jgi:4-alpha-glucanotransferase
MRIRAVPFCSLDVAVGVDPAGFDAWNEQEAILRDFSIGAPPDGFNPGGQNWGLVLELSARAPAVGLLRQLMASHLTKRGFAAMGLGYPIEHAPKNGDLIFLMDARLDARSEELGRWASEVNEWVKPNGTPLRFFPTHWRPWGPLPEQTQKRLPTRLILASVAAIVCIGGIVFWIEPEDSSSGNSAANLERKFSQERDRASVAIAGFTAARERENVGLTKQRELKQALDESEKRALALERENAAQKQTADAKQTELKQALDESGARSDALARELASARKNDVAARDLAAARERENAAQKKQTELKQALDESEKRAGASEQLTRSNRSQSDRSQPPMSSVEEAKLIAHAESLIKQFDFAGARLLLAHASEKGSARAAFMMAETYDWQVLRSLQAYGVRGDAEKAWEFYQMAARAGIEKARERAEALQQDANFGTRVGREDRSR